MRILEQAPELETKLRRTPERDARLAQWLQTEIEAGFAARHAAVETWGECLRQYKGLPKTPIRNTPIENAPNLEVTLGAIANDAIYAQAIDLIFAAQPILTCRATSTDSTETDRAAALQRWVNWGVANEWQLRPAVEAAVLDDTQLGTGFLYCPWVQTIKKTDVQRITEKGARILAWPIEDVIVQGGATTDLQRVPWFALRSWLTEGDLALRKQNAAWEIDRFSPTAGLSRTRQRREQLGRTVTNTKLRKLYEVLEVYCLFDYDEDGIEEDLYVVYNRGSAAVGKVTFTPYDSRPAAAMRYQLQGGLFYGLGVLEMMQPYQADVTEMRNEYALNVMLSNAKFWKVREGTVDPDNTTIWLNKMQPLPDPTNDMIPCDMGNTYPSIPEAMAFTIGMAYRRVGVKGDGAPGAAQSMGTRTPGITAMSVLQEANRRFTPAFDQMRTAVGEAVKQCLYRYQERLLAGDRDVEDHITDVLGPQDAATVIAILRDPEFDQQIHVELTASSASVNKEADRQSALMVLNLVGQYYDKVLMWSQVASNQQIAPAVRDAAMKIATASSRIVQRALETFDFIRDPQAFIVNVEAEMQEAQQAIDMQTAGALGPLLQNLNAGSLGGSSPALIPSAGQL